MPLLFVYGSLKQGFRLHPHLRGSEFRGPAQTVPGFALYALGWYPGMVMAANAGSVSGELYEVPESMLPGLDRLEGAPDLFQRVEIEVIGPDETHLKVLTYLYQRSVEHRPQVTDGCWTVNR